MKDIDRDKGLKGYSDFRALAARHLYLAALCDSLAP
jgi:hypothetical protein